jgi:hypothetical protein
MEMDFLLMAIGHNFRKMIAKNNNPSEVHLKISMRTLNGAIKV